MKFAAPLNSPFTAYFFGVDTRVLPRVISEGNNIVYSSSNPFENALKVNFFRGGTFYTNFNFSGIKILPLETIQLPQLPAPERNREKKPIVKYNPALITSPARIYSQTGEIELGKYFHSLQLPFKMFILFHEYGHFFYNTEWKADAYAFYHFIKRGGNPSAAIDCLKKILTTNGKNADVNAANINRILTLFNIAK